jgi:AcrR family transcriptional regulator
VTTPAASAASIEDLTARARIRDAAIALIAEHGVEAATIREIAGKAGVSGGLVRHHFGSKEGLRAACDAYALARVMEIKEEAVLGEQIAAPGFLSAVQPQMALLIRYFARSMMDGSEAADAMFDEMVSMTESWIAEHHDGHIRDPHAYATVLIAMELGSLVLRDQMSRSLGADVFTPEGHLRLIGAKVDFYSQPLLRPEFAEQVHGALDGTRQPQPPVRKGRR